MARARNIKPGFFLNDDLAKCHPLARLMFAGLWCIADRAGRLLDRPDRIKAEILPYDQCDAEDLLSQLAARKFIHRYEVDGVRYILVPEFCRHQNPHKNEAPSTIPAAPGLERSGTSTVQAPECSHTRPQQIGLIPSSLIPDSFQEIPSPNGDGSIEQVEGPQVDPRKAQHEERLTQVTRDAIESYNASPLVKKNGGLLPAVKMGAGFATRRQQVKRCVKMAREICAKELQSPVITREFWEQYWSICDADDFLAGRQEPGKGHENWSPDFEFLTKPKTMLRVYNNSESEE